MDEIAPANLVAFLVTGLGSHNLILLSNLQLFNLPHQQPTLAGFQHLSCFQPNLPLNAFLTIQDVSAMLRFESFQPPCIPFTEKARLRIAQFRIPRKDQRAFAFLAPKGFLFKFHLVSIQRAVQYFQNQSFVTHGTPHKESLTQSRRDAKDTQSFSPRYLCGFASLPRWIMPPSTIGTIIQFYPTGLREIFFCKKFELDSDVLVKCQL